MNGLLLAPVTYFSRTYDCRNSALPLFAKVAKCRLDGLYLNKSFQHRRLPRPVVAQKHRPLRRASVIGREIQRLPRPKTAHVLQRQAQKVSRRQLLRSLVRHPIPLSSQKNTKHAIRNTKHAPYTSTASGPASSRISRRRSSVVLRLPSWLHPGGPKTYPRRSRRVSPGCVASRQRPTHS